jgi:hypothetical protein
MDAEEAAVGLQSFSSFYAVVILAEWIVQGSNVLANTV